MLPRCLPPSFDSIQLTFQEQITIKNFQDGRCGSNLGYRNKMILAVLISMSPKCLPPSFSSIRLTIGDFQDGHSGHHLWYQNRMILAILNLYAAPIPRIKFWPNQTVSLGDVIWRISRWPPWQPSWIWNRRVLAILNLHVSPMTPTKFRLTLTYRSDVDVVWRFSRWLPSWDIGTEPF